MGLFTGTPSSASRRSTSSAPLKRRSLGRLNKDSSGTSFGPSSDGAQSAAPDNHTAGGADGAAESIGAVSLPSTQTSVKAKSESGTHKGPPLPTQETHGVSVSDEEPELDLADLQPDNAFLYERHLPLDSAIGLVPLSAEVSILERIDAYIAEHYLECFGITHQDEIVDHHNRLIPFFAKAPRFLSIHSLKRKELERDYTDAPDTTETCARKQLCLGRCLLGFECPTQDLTVTQHSGVS